MIFFDMSNSNIATRKCDKVRMLCILNRDLILLSVGIGHYSKLDFGIPPLEYLNFFKNFNCWEVIAFNENFL